MPCLCFEIFCLFSLFPFPHHFLHFLCCLLLSRAGNTVIFSQENHFLQPKWENTRACVKIHSFLSHWLMWFPESWSAVRKFHEQEVGHPTWRTNTEHITFLTQTKCTVDRVLGLRALTSQRHIASFLSPSRTPRVDIVPSLSSVCWDKTDKRWSHVSTTHNGRNRGRASQAVEAGYWHKPWVMFFSTFFCDSWVLKEQDVMCHTSCHFDLLYVNLQSPTNA